MRLRRVAAVPLVLLVTAAPFGVLAGGEGDVVAPNLPPLINLVQVASGLTSPILATHAGDGSGRMFFVEQRGLVHQRVGGTMDPVPWLDVRSKVVCCGERGLLGLAFHPNFETNGIAIISYTRAGDGATVIEKLTVANPLTGRPSPNGQVVLTHPQPFSNHNGGGVAFGPDGNLYIAIGDGGSGGDPQNNAQNPNNLLGKMVRINVDGASGYTVPAGNMFPNGNGGRAEICSMGLRNPWRWSFDRGTGDLWIADVGQNLWEEVNRVDAGTPCGQNYGWRPWEGFYPYNPVEALNPARLDDWTFPVIAYNHFPHCSVTGGYVHRGPGTVLEGAYLYGDYCSGVVWALIGAEGVYANVQLLDTPYNISSFGEDEAGNVYLVHYGGAVYRIDTL
jgi:glucose/arabinose dehydrogenase